MRKNIKRPLRIFTNEDKPYIIYKSKKYFIKGTNISEILNFIKRLQKKSVKKIPDKKIDKKEVKKYLNESIKLTGGPSSSSNIGKDIEKETFKINELNNKLEEIKKINEKLKDEIKSIENKENNIKAIQNNDDEIDKLIIYDNQSKLYQLPTNFGTISGLTIEDVKKDLNKGLIDVYNGYKKDVEDLKNEKLLVEKEMNNIIEQKNNIEIKVNELEKREKILQEENKKLENKYNLFEDAYSILEKDKNIIQRDKEELEIKQQNLNKELKRAQILNNNRDLESIKKYYKNRPEYQDEILPIILDEQKKKLNNRNIKDVLNKIWNITGEGKYKSDGLWNYQIDKIMKPFKYYLKAIPESYLEEMIDYIYKNNIIKGSFILNINKHWVSIYWDLRDEFVVEYYDPFGDEPKKNIIKAFKDLVLKFNIDVFVKFKINKVQQQDVNSSNCGWFAMYFLIMRYNGYEFKYITKFSNVKQEEKNIEDLKLKYDKFGFI